MCKNGRNLFKVFSQHLPPLSEENHGKSHSYNLDYNSDFSRFIREFNSLNHNSHWPIIQML